MRKRMSWSWVGEYPVFVYTVWLRHKVFRVDIVVGVKGDQNAGNTGPSAKPNLSYIERGFNSKEKVVHLALGKARELLSDRSDEKVLTE